jgi:GNAT superfamily N-acetyltransferase/RNA:NAD 2'-phosphotransferase (TPT1/KptA family)
MPEEKVWEPWVGVDLDATLAQELSEFNPLIIGQPIPAMVDKVKNLIKSGKTVKVFTARLADEELREKIQMLIAAWTKRHIGVALDSTNEKDPGLELILDDKAQGVVPNTGELKTAAEKYETRPGEGEIYAFTDRYDGERGEGEYTGYEIAYDHSGERQLLHEYRYKADCTVTKEYVPINRLQHTQSSRELDKERVEEIKRGLSLSWIEAVLVTTTDGKNFRLSDGHHRVEAAEQMGFKTIPAIVVRLDYGQDWKIAASTPSWIPSFESLLEEYIGEITEEDKGRYNHHIQALSALIFPLTIYRHILVNSINDIHFDGLGRFWATDESLAISHNADENSGDVEVMLRAVVNPDEIDWMDTVYARIIFGENEDEISIAPGTTINVTGMRVDKGEWQTPPVGMKTAAPHDQEAFPDGPVDFFEPVENPHTIQPLRAPVPVEKFAGAPDTPEFKAWFSGSEVVNPDGSPIVYTNAVEDKGQDSWIAFRPDQVKSAIGNSGNYDPKNTHITATAKRPSKKTPIDDDGWFTPAKRPSKKTPIDDDGWLTPDGTFYPNGRWTHLDALYQTGIIANDWDINGYDFAYNQGFIRISVGGGGITPNRAFMETPKPMDDTIYDRLVAAVKRLPATVTEINAWIGSGENFKKYQWDGRQFLYSGGNRWGKFSSYTAYVLTDASRELLLKNFPPKFPDVIAHHVTFQFGVSKDAPEPPPATLVVEGYASDESLEALIVSVDGKTERPDGSTYHITLSLDRSQGRTPKDSNAVIKANGWHPVEHPFAIQVVAQKLAKTAWQEIVVEKKEEGVFKGDLLGGILETLADLKDWGAQHGVSSIKYLRTLKGKKVAVIDDFNVAEKGKGYGTKMLQEFTDQAIAAGCDVILLEAGINQPQNTGFNLLEWYKRLGFVPFIQAKGALPLMIKWLKKKTAKQVGPVFHGTNQDFKEFELTKGKRVFFGLSEIEVKSGAFFFTEDPKKAQNWASNRQNGREPLYVIECNLTMDQTLDTRDPSWVDAEVPYVLLPFNDVPRSAGPEGSGGLLEVLRDLIGDKMNEADWREMGIDIDQLEVVNDSLLFLMIDTPVVMEALKYLKYDSMILDEGPDPEIGGTSYAVFNKNQIKVLKRRKVSSKPASSEEPGLLFRSPGTSDRNNDYNPNWDYEVEENPPVDLVVIAKRASESLYTKLKQQGIIDGWMFGFEVWAVNLKENAVAMYINGTYDFPVILIDLEKHRGYEDQIGKSIQHELRHAVQESKEEDFDEDDAELDEEFDKQASKEFWGKWWVSPTGEFVPAKGKEGGRNEGKDIHDAEILGFKDKGKWNTKNWVSAEDAALAAGYARVVIEPNLAYIQFGAQAQAEKMAGKIIRQIPVTVRKVEVEWSTPRNGYLRFPSIAEAEDRFPEDGALDLNSLYDELREYKTASSLQAPKTFYHVSRKRNRASIQSRGLLPQIVEFTELERKPGIYLLETEEQAYDWAWCFGDGIFEDEESDDYDPRAGKEIIDVWAVDLPAGITLTPDKTDMDERYDSWVIYDPVPAESVHLLGTVGPKYNWDNAPAKPQKVQRTASASVIKARDLSKGDNIQGAFVVSYVRRQGDEIVAFGRGTQMLRFGLDDEVGVGFGAVTASTPEFDAWFSGSKVVNSDGTPKVVYHGTGADIKAFDYEFTGQGNDQLGSGFYFTDSKETASGYTTRMQNDQPKPGGEQANVMPVYLCLKKPIHVVNGEAKEPDLTAAQIRKIIVVAPNLDDVLTNFGDVSFEGKANVLKAAVDSYTDAPLLRQLFTLATDFYRDDVKGFNEIVRKVTGYDGVIAEFGTEDLWHGNQTHYVAWFPNQIKSAIGNVGKFDKKNPSITASGEEFPFQINLQVDGGYVRGRILEDDEDLRGWAEDVLLEEPEELEMILNDGPPWASMGSVKVDFDKRGTGLGKKLVSQFIDAARAKGATSIILLAAPEGEQKPGFDLIRWYEGLGFTELTTTEQGLSIMERSTEPLKVSSFIATKLDKTASSPFKPDTQHKWYRNGTPDVYGETAGDVVRYEQEEVGNDYGITEDQLAYLDQFPASAVQWVGRTQKAVERYSRLTMSGKWIDDDNPDTPEDPADHSGIFTVYIERPEIIADDGESDDPNLTGYLVLDASSKRLSNITASEFARDIGAEAYREFTGGKTAKQYSLPGISEDYDREDILQEHFDSREEAARDLLEEYKEHFGDWSYRQRWEVVPAARLKRIWNDYVKYGFVRDEKGLDEIAHIFVTNVHRLEVNTILCGHSSTDPIGFAEDVLGVDLPEDYFDHDDSFFEDDNGSWLISDYAVKPLNTDALKLRSAHKAEEKLQIIDHMLNIVHCRSDLAGWFVEGGSKTLSQLSGMGSKTAAEIYEQERDEYAGKWDAEHTDEQNRARYHRKNEWDQSLLAAISLGQYDPAEADNRKGGVAGISGKLAEAFKPLPQTLYHVTTAASKVKSQGLQSRFELSMEQGVGLGGGDDKSISFTPDLKIAEGIYSAMIEAKRAAAGEFSVQQMMDIATKGTGASRPWVTEFVQWAGAYRVSNKWTPGQPLPEDMQAILEGKKVTGEGAFHGKTKEELDAEGLGPIGEGWESSKGHLWNYWKRPMTAEEKQAIDFDQFKVFCYARENAGGALNPLFFSTDVKSLAKVSESEIAILQYKPIPGAMGTYVPGLDEWRTYAGGAVTLVQVMQPGLGKTASTPFEEYLGNCTEDDVVESIFGDATLFAQALEGATPIDETTKRSDEYGVTIKYDPETDIHSFYKTAANLPMVLFHGTSVYSWAQSYPEGLLYLTSNLSNAEGYAEEAASNSFSLEEDDKPLVLEIAMKELFKPGVVLGADWNARSDPRDPEPKSWRDTLNRYGTLTVKGDIESLKPKFRVVGSKTASKEVGPQAQVIAKQPLSKTVPVEKPYIDAHRRHSTPPTIWDKTAAAALAPDNEELNRWLCWGKIASGTTLSDTILYHVTLTKNVPKIMKQGLLRFQPSNWVTGNKQRYGEGEIYAFTDRYDALRWAAKMDWEFNTKTGSGKISIVRIKPGEEKWEVDNNDPLSQFGKHGDWLKSQRAIPASQIIDAFPVGASEVQELVAANNKVASFGPPEFEDIVWPNGVLAHDLVDWSLVYPEGKRIAEEQGLNWEELSSDEQEELVRPIITQNQKPWYDAIREIYDRHSAIRVYRALDLMGGVNQAASEYAKYGIPGFGNAWSWDESGADTYCSEYGGKNKFVFRGWVLHPDVDWDTTFHNNVANDLEKEIRLYPGVPVKLDAYKEFRTNAWKPIPERLRSVTASSEKLDGVVFTRNIAGEKFEITAFETQTLPVGDVVDEADIYEYCKSHHHNPEDFYEGDIGERIEHYPFYILQKVPLSKIDTNEWDTLEDVVAEYAGLNTPFPPIVIYPDGTIVDGTHRANAAKQRGDTEILAWVGTRKKNASEDDWGEEGDEYNFETQTLPAGTILYHGTDASQWKPQQEQIESPAWFSQSRSVAEQFSTWNGDKKPVVAEYRTTQPIELVVIHNRRDLDSLCEKYQVFEEGSTRDMADELSNYIEGWIIPNNYPDGDDIMIGDASNLEFVQMTKAIRPAHNKKRSALDAGKIAARVDTTTTGKLYHGTSMSGIVGILRDNAMYEGAYWERENEPHGVRLTRSKQIANIFAIEGLSGSPSEGAIIEFNAQALAQDYKLMDYEDVDCRGEKWGKPEKEVVVLTPKIPNIRKYITAIYLKNFKNQKAVNDYALLVEDEERMLAKDWLKGYVKLLKDPLVRGTKVAATKYTGPYAFYIEVPKSARDHFWEEPEPHNFEFWAFRSRPTCLKGERIIFTMDKKPVAETVCHHVEKPGESKCELTGKFEKHWKAYWDPKDFKKYKTAAQSASVISRSLIAQTIKDVVKEWGVPAKAINTDCNRGCCDDFANDVYHKLEADMDVTGLESVSVASFLQPGEEGYSDVEGAPFDRRLLKAHWPSVVPPSGLTWKDMNRLSADAGFCDGTHVWLTWNSLHFDSEAPNGVPNFFDLPFFKRVIASWLSEHKTASAVQEVRLKPNAKVSLIEPKRMTVTAAIQLPTGTIRELWHVGTMDKSQHRSGSHEGNGLSVSTEPDAWEQINEFTSGDHWKLTKAGNKFLNFHRMSKTQQKQLFEWGTQQGYVQPQNMWRCWQCSEEGEDAGYFEFPTLREALEEAGVVSLDEAEEAGIHIEEDKEGYIPTEKFNTRMGEKVEQAFVLDFLAMIYAEDVLNLDGVWWQDRLDIPALSAPRGVIFNSKLPTWKAEKEKTAAVTNIPPYIYHGTSSALVSSIMSTGLQERSYFSTEPVALWFANNKATEDGSKPVVLQVATATLNLKDMDRVKRLLPGGLIGVKDCRIWRYLHPVSPELITVKQTEKVKTSSETISGEEVLQYLMKLNKWSKETALQVLGVDGYGSQYTLREFSLSRLKPGDDWNPELSDQYAKRPTPFPPIILGYDFNWTTRRKKLVIKDGNHRVDAAKSRGDKSIQAYVPID